MQEAVLKGIGLGLLLATLVGPVFFSLLQTSIHRGFFAGVLMAIGISLSDSIYIFLTNFFLLAIQDTTGVEHFLGLFGGFVLLGVGILTFMRKPINEATQASLAGYTRSRLRSLATVLRGFLMNFAHPGVLIFWISVITLINTEWNYDLDDKVALFTATIATVFTTDVLKALMAHQVKRFLNYNVLLWMNRVMGVVLMVFGMHLFLRTLTGW